METIPQTGPAVKKKILLLSCKGGYGHEAACSAIQEIGREQYTFIKVFPIEEISSFGKTSGADVYNAFLRKNWIRSMNFISNKLVPLLLHTRVDSAEMQLLAHIEREKPDLILSLIPFVNYPASEAARKANVPYLLITTDNDLTNWVLGMQKIRHPAFKVTIGQEHPLTSGLLASAGIAEDKVEEIGLPVHPFFLRSSPPKEVKSTFRIPEDKPVVTIIMGGAGGARAFSYAKELQKSSFPLHVVICTGNNTLLYNKLKHLEEEPGMVSFSVLRFTGQIAELMQVSNLLITKPGPGTINEAMLRNLPILVDNTHENLFWERVNLELVVDAGIGQTLDQVEEVNRWVSLYLQDDKTKEDLKAAYLRMNRPSFQDNVCRVIEETISLGVSV